MTAINTCKLGYLSVEVFFATGIKEEIQRKKLLDALRESDIVEMVSELGGEFEYGISFYVRDPAEVANFFQHLSTDFGDVFFNRVVAVKQSYFGFGRKYLLGKRISPIISMPSSVSPVAIDATDHRILKELTKINVGPHSTIARTLKIPETTLDYRIKKLKEKGVIVRSIYGVDMSSEEILYFRLFIYTRSYAEEFRTRLYDFCAAHLNIVNLVCVLGAWDYQIGVEVTRQEDLQQVLHEIQADFGSQINRITVLPIFRISKMKNYPFSGDLPQ